MQWLEQSCADNTVYGGQYLPALFQHSCFDGMDNGRGSGDPWKVLSVWFRKNLFRSTNWVRRLLDKVGKFFLIEEHGFLQRCQILLLVCGLNSYWVRVPRNALTYKWEYFANKSVEKRGFKKHKERQGGDHTESDYTTEGLKANEKKYCALNV